MDALDLLLVCATVPLANFTPLPFKAAHPWLVHVLGAEAHEKRLFGVFICNWSRGILQPVPMRKRRKILPGPADRQAGGSEMWSGDGVMCGGRWILAIVMAALRRRPSFACGK